MSWIKRQWRSLMDFLLEANVLADGWRANIEAKVLALDEEKKEKHER